MRRIVATLLSLTLALVVSGSGAAGATSRSERAGSETLSVPTWLHKAWFQWAFGGSTAPLLHRRLCGEQVGSVFFLTLAGGVKTDDIRHVRCEIPRHTTVLAPLGGSVTWSNTLSDQEMHADVFKTLARLIVHSVHVRLDGDELPHGPLVAPDPYTISLEPGNLIETVDPTITGNTVRICDAWYFTLLAPLHAGSHVLVTTDKFDYPRHGVAHYRTTFAIDVP
jgi:hypothetical protein